MGIQLLANEVASQIAAGEVVERPASAVKELIENAIDAGARFINITIEGAGKRLIEIADDGAGIAGEELELAVTRHATSKLSTSAELFHITTLGFRGEALASIGSVSILTVTTRQADAPMGSQMRVEGGMIGTVTSAGAPIGTVVRVENLFYNVPARLKFLKSDSTERSQIDNLVTRYALAYPDIRFHLKQEGKISLQTGGRGDRRAVLGDLYGAETARKMLEVISDSDGIRVSGFISPISLTRSNRRELTFFVNGRPVQDASLATAVLQAYHNLLMVGRYPMVALFIDMPPEEVDVNVHPTKAEIRFRSRDAVFSSVQRAVRRALLAHSPAPGLETGSIYQGGWGQESTATSNTIDPAWDFARDLQTQPNPPEEPGEWEEPASTPTQTPLPGGVPLLRLVGQLASAYLVAEGPDGLYLIDQHAAHERVLYEKFMASRGEGVPSQALLKPAAVEIPPAGARILESELPVLSKFGFQVESFGTNTFLVRAVPTLLSGIEPGAALRVLVEDFEEDETPLAAELEARIIARVCKRAAVKAGKILSPEEQKALLADLENCRSPRTCPHGRPTMIHLPVDLLERQFGRRGAR